MPGYRSPYSSRPRRRSNNLAPTLIMGTMGLLIIVLGLFLIADRLGGSPLGSSNSASGTPGASSVAGGVTASPTAVDPAKLRSATEVARAYTELWNNSDYFGMYALISVNSKQTISEQDFVNRYQAIAQEAGETSLKVTMGDVPSDATRVPIHVVRESGKVGHMEEDNLITMVRDGEVWRVDWTPSLIYANLGDGFIRWKPEVPQRGRILDRKGRPLAHLGNISKVGVIPGQIKDEPAMLAKLSELLGMSQERIKEKYAGGQADWFMPLKNFPDQMDQKTMQDLAAIPGVVVQKWPERVYPAGPAAAHVVGFLSEVTAEELPEKSKQGYGPGDRIGRLGIEAWGEQYLSGKRGGRLTIVGPDGAERKTIAQVKGEPSADIILTLDLDVQHAAMQALGDKTGSMVVIDPATGGILAMASNPTFDPNMFILGVSDEEWARLNDPEQRPLANRATQSAYPSGSVFKVVTMTAGMQQFGLTGESMVDCPATFSLPGADNVWRDWKPNGQGRLTLHNALTQSCNTVFYKIGADLDAKDPNLLPMTAEAFGFGKPTGLPELPEVAGVVPSPQWKLDTIHDYWARGDAVNFAIGQGYFLATPLQVADAYAAIANGGTLWQPFLVQEVKKLDGTKVYTAQPKERGKLPNTPEQLNTIRSAMKDVVSAPNGTAVDVFKGEAHPVAGKSGTAETGMPNSHAWFAAFTPIDDSKLAVVAMVEGGNAGSGVGAPMTREVIDAYYAANPR